MEQSHPSASPTFQLRREAPPMRSPLRETSINHSNPQNPIGANEPPVDVNELVAAVEILQKLRTSLLRPSGVPDLTRKPSVRPESPTVPPYPDVASPKFATSAIDKLEGRYEAAMRPTLSSRRPISISGPLTVPENYPLPPREEQKRTNWRHSLLSINREPSGKRNSRRTSGLFGPGGPATSLNPEIPEVVVDDMRDNKSYDGNQIASEVRKRCYITKLARALMVYGAPAHRIERYLAMTARAIRIDVEFFYLPDHMTLYFNNKDTETTETKLVRGGGTDLGRWEDAHEVSKLVICDAMSINAAIDRLDEIERRAAKHSDWFLLLIYGLAAIGIGPFAYRARFVDLPISFFMGIGLGVLQLKCAPSNQLYSVLFEVSAAVIMSFLGRMFGSIKNAQGDRIFCYAAITESAINLIQPGYWITNACLELMNRQIATSGARLMYALVYALLLAYGIAIGSALYGIIDHDAVVGDQCENQIDIHWNLFFVPFFCIQVAILGGAKWRQIPAMVIITVASYYVFFFSLFAFRGSFTISVTLGALTMGIFGNLYSRLGARVEHSFRKRFSMNGNPQSDPERGIRETTGVSKFGYALGAAGMVPAMIVLVPSGLANRASLLAGITTANAITRNETANFAVGPAAEVMTIAFPMYLNVFQHSLALAVGLSLGALLIYPFGKKRSWVMSW